MGSVRLMWESSASTRSPAAAIGLEAARGAALDRVHAIHFTLTAALAEHFVGGTGRRPFGRRGDLHRRDRARQRLQLRRVGSVGHAAIMAWIDNQLVARGIRDARVLDATRRVPRHVFVEADAQALAYADRALPIGDGQTISQPYMVAAMTEALRLQGHEHVLDVGTGSGYQAAILAELARDVVTIERRPELADAARA